MISASLSFSSNNNSAVAAISSERWLKAVRRYFLDAFSARFRRFSISASSNGENSFSFSPVAGLIEAIGISVPYIAFTTNGGANSVSPASQSSALHIDCVITIAGLWESERGRAHRKTIAQAAPVTPREPLPPRSLRDRSN